MMHALIDVLRQSLSSLRSRLQFTLFAVVVLGFGIAANCAVFVLINSIFLRELPYAEVDRLVEISGGPPPAPMLELSRASSFTGVAAFASRGFSVRTAEGYRNLYGFRVTPNLFEVLGVKAALGRALEAEDANRPVVVLSYSYWRRVSGSPDIIGQTLTIAEDQPRTIVGVMPADFTMQVRDANLFVPFRVEDGRVLARMRPGVTQQQAEQETVSVFRALDTSAVRRERPPRVIPIAEAFRPNNGQTVTLFQAAVGLVLLMTCANLANLLLVHGTSRRREFAIRGAIGASRGRLLAQLITENAMIAVLGGVVGLGLTSLSLDYLEQTLPANMTRVLRGAEGLSIDMTVAGFAFVVSLATVLVFGLAPAISALRFDLLSALREAKSTTSLTSRRFGNALVAVEVALAMMLLVAGGLMLKSLVGLYNRDLGFTAERVLRTPIDLPRSRYPQTAERIQALQALLDRMRALPGVEAGAIAGPQLFPFGGPRVGGALFSIGGRPDVQPRADFYYTTPDYFRVLQIPLLRGRLFTDGDSAATVPVALVSEVVANRYQLREGEQVRQTPNGPPITIVGVVGNVRNPVGEDFTPLLYVPLAQTDVTGGTFLIRTAGDPLSIVPAVRKEVLSADPNASELRVANLVNAVSSYVSAERFTTTLLGTFASIGLLLAALGIFAVTRYWVSARVPEIGVRMALGATPAQIIRHVITRSATSAGLGIVMGSAGVFAVQKLIASQLHGVSPLDPYVNAQVILIVLITAAAAAALPARSAIKVDPATALRQD